MLTAFFVCFAIPFWSSGKESVIKLKSPSFKSSVSVEEALKARRSIRDFPDDPLTLDEISQLLWAGQGLTNKRGYRTNPSAGATFPIELYLAAHNVTGLEPGLYHYSPHKETLTLVKEGSLRDQLTVSALNQGFVQKSAAVIIISAVFQRTADKYRERAVRYVHMEVGSIYQSIHLQAETLGLGTVVVGAFNDDTLKKLLGIEEVPLIIMPIGRKK